MNTLKQPAEDFLDNKKFQNDGFSFYSKYNVLLQTINDGLMLITDGSIRYTNKILADMLEYTIEEMTELKLEDIIADNYKDFVLHRYKKRLNGEFVPTQYKIEVVTKSGKHIPVSLNIGLVSSGQEKLEFVIVTNLYELENKDIEIKNREKEFETIFNHSFMALSIVNLDGKITQVNNKWKSIFVQKGSPANQKNISDIFLSEDVDKLNSLKEEMIINNIDHSREEIVLIKNGQDKFWADLSISAVKDSDNKIRYFIYSLIDINDKIEREKWFEKENKLQQYFMEYVPDSIYFKDRDSKFIKANKATVIKMGLNSINDLLGKTDYDFFDDVHANIAKFDEESIISNGTSILNKIEKEIWPNGTITWASTTKIPLRDDDNNIIGTFGITRDVTRLKKSEDIRNALYKISTAVTSVPDIQNLFYTIHQIIKDLMKAENFYIAIYNEESDTVSFPYFVDEVDPKPEERKTGNGLTEYILRNGVAQLIDSETDIKLRESGETSLLGEPTQIWLGVPLKVEGKTIGVIVVQDYKNPKTYGENEKEILTYVSEQIALAIDKKYREEKIIGYSEELKESNITKDKFFSILAHDLKSPFHGLLGLSRMIFEEYDSLDDDELRSSLEILKDSTENTYKLIENLLDWSRLQTGKMKYQPSLQNMFMVVEDVKMLLIQNSKLKDITIRNKISHTSLVWGDLDMLHSLVQNIISNSIKFTPNGGNIEITELSIDDKVQFTISDNGVGIKQKDIDKLFRLDVSFSTRGTMDEKGTGLGLVLCKEIINVHNGDIKIQSEPGIGTKIIFTLNKRELIT